MRKFKTGVAMRAARLASVLTVLMACACPLAAAAQTLAGEEATALADILVDGRPLRSVVQSFVGSVAAPAGDRGPARWDGPLCVGVLNLATGPAQFLADRVSDIGAELKIAIAEPGCKPNLVVMFTSEGADLAKDLVRTRRREFLVGTSGATLGRDALEAFQNSDRAVRWWAVSIPVNEDTGKAAVRLPGQGPFPGGAIERPSDLGSFGVNGPASRLTSSIKDLMQQVLVIVDINEMGAADFTQIADYVALVGLAQIDPEAETGGFDSILNLFDPDVAPPPALAAFDWAYLRGVYGATQRAGSGRGLVAEVAAGMERELRSQPEP